MLKSIFIITTGFILSSSVIAEQTTTDTQAVTTTEGAGMTQQAVPQEAAQPEAIQDTAQETTAPAATEAMAEEQSGFSRGSVMRAAFTNGIENREPVDDMKTAGNNSNKITFFTELRDMSGQTAKHRWEHNGEVMAEVEFNVGGPRWRVWSSKSLMPKWEGEWKVSVLNAAGEVISEELISYKEPVQAEAAPAAEMQDSGDPAPGLYEPSTTDSPQQ